MLDIRDALGKVFPEREEVIDGMIASVLTKSHVLLLGPPGTAKSALARAVAGAFQASYFEWLLTKFTTPEELFGPISLKALEQDHYRRVTAGKLPEAQFGFVDEVFKGSSSILNTMLSLINERVFHNDGAPQAAPLVTLIGASNEMPEGNDTGALWDRFLLRFEVGYLRRPKDFKAMIQASEPAMGLTLTPALFAAAVKEVEDVRVTTGTVEALANVRDMLNAEGIVSSDRRWKQALKLCKAFAWLEGYSETSAEDLQPLADALWSEPKNRPLVAAILGKVSDPAAHEAQVIVDAAKEIVQGLRKPGADFDKAKVQAASMRALSQFKEQHSALQKLSKRAGPRAAKYLAAAEQEIKSMHEELAQGMAEALRL
jgi:MoxR-like ATPase